MAGRSDMSLSEVAAIAHRETRRSNPIIGSSKFGPASTGRASVSAGSENVSMGGVRHSPRLGNGNCAAQARLPRTAGGLRVGAPFTDITNGTEQARESKRGRPGQAYGKRRQAQGAPPLPGQASVPVPPLAPPSAAPSAAPTAGSRQLSAQGQLSQTLAPPALPAEVNPIQDNVANAQSVNEYEGEIYSKLFRDEATLHTQITLNCMEAQTDLNGKMRAILIDWLIEVHMKYRLRPETLFLTVNLIDRYLSHSHVTRKKLQLVGVVAMLMAAKFEEINPPEVHDFVYITDNAYKKDDILNMECTMLTALNFKIVVPTAAHFFERLQKSNHCDDVHREVAEYIIELGLLDIRMLRYPPSHLVSAALMLSNELLGKRPTWPHLMVQQSQRTEPTLRACADEYRELLDAAPTSQLQALRKKFSQPQRHNVARMTF